NLVVRYVVATFCDAGTNPRDVQFRTGESHVPHANLNALGERPLEQRGHAVSTQGGFESEDQTSRDGRFEQAFAFLPRGDVGVAVGQMRTCRLDEPCRLVRIEVVRAQRAYDRSADTALAGAVGSRQDVDAGGTRGFSHVAARGGVCA